MYIEQESINSLFLTAWEKRSFRSNDCWLFERSLWPNKAFRYKNDIPIN